MVETLWHDIGAAHCYLRKVAGDATKTYALVGTLYRTDNNWLLLSVPNALVRGAFDALHEPGTELPPDSETGRLNAHITVMGPEEVEKIGPDRISERGHQFRYTLGPVKEVVPAGWKDVSRVWYITADSPELRNLRKSYGLPPLRNGFDHHITIAIRRKKVLQDNMVTKSSAAPVIDPHDEDGDAPYGICPECGMPFSSRCRCRMGDRTCPNGHAWHICPTCDKLAPGTGHGHPDGPQACHCRPTPLKAAEATEAAGASGASGSYLDPRTLTDPQQTLPQLLQAKAESDRRNWAVKHRIVRQLVQARPQDFFIDSRQGDMMGLTHQPTGFRLHVPARIMPVRLEERILDHGPPAADPRLANRALAGLVLRASGLANTR